MLYLQAPVKLLSAVEFHLLRLASLLQAHALQSLGSEADITLQSLMTMLGELINQPEIELADDASSVSSNAAIMHTFTWDRPLTEGGQTAAIAFGLVSLCNHASEDEAANAGVRLDREGLSISLVASDDIQAGEEILIKYRSTPFDG